MVRDSTLEELLRDCPNNWGKWGEKDEIGCLNYLDENQVLRGIKAVSKGKVFSLGVPIAHPNGDPVFPGRTQAIRINRRDRASYVTGKVERRYGGLESADDLIIMYLHGTTHIDALGHPWYGDKIWNGYNANETVHTVTKASIFPIAQKGIIGRGVLIDVARCKGKDHLSRGEEIKLEDLITCSEKQGIKIEKRDIILIRTGWLKLFYEKGKDEFYRDFLEPGLTYRKETVNWFKEMEIPLLGTDTLANEMTKHPETGIMLPLHAALIRNLGVIFNEIVWLEDLANDCAMDNKWDFLYVASPLKVYGGTGSPVNPLAIK